ncbi:uncharacterized protein LOC131060909 isoform X1 [Cryptomeria japonica]|uniref:uncharacterized protein LOC131060909 isoform X1 n=1 Tax=Cryptomeria japonica TaxID=3369 RepID=UPI0027DA69D5|nr:uncharacterized protein LOC131060909 isoform X1 [Cryptomeria japonica]
MDDSWQLRACSSSRSSSQHFPLPGGSRNQMEMNFGQFSHPYVAQEVCVIERTIRQEPVAPNSASYGYSGCSTKMARPELGNSFLALLSGPSQPFRSEYQQSSSIRSAVLAGNSPFYQINALENGSWPPLAAADVSSVSQISGNGGFGNGLELSHIGTSRESLPTGYNRVTTFPDNFDPVNVRSHVSDILKQGIRSTVNDSEAELHTSVPQWLTEAANLRQQQLHSIQSTRLPKTLTGTRYNEVEQSLSVMKARPRVFCVGTNGMMSGELVLSDTGRLGVLCSCHNHHMSVAKFSEHAGQASCNPGSAVHMENGETLVMWRKAFFFQFGVKVPDDEKGWDWNDGNSSETGAVKCKTANTQNIEKENLLLYQMDHPTVKPRNAQFCNNPVYCNNSYEENVTQGSSGGSFFPSAAQKNMHEVREALLKNINKVCKGSMPTQMSQPLLERLKDDFSKVPDMSGSNSCRGSSNYVNNPVAEYIDFINSGGRTLITNQSPAGLKFFQKGFTLNNTSNMQEPVPQEKDSMSSSFELRLGQPSQQRHGIGGPLPDSLDSQVSSAAIDRQKSLFLQHMWQRVYDPSIAEGSQQNATCILPGYSGNKEKGKERWFDNQPRGVERTNMVQSACIDHLKGDSVRGSVVSMYLQPSERPNGLVDDSPSPSMNKVMGNPHQLVNKMMHMNPNSHGIAKHDLPEGLRSKFISIPNKGFPQSEEYGCNSSQTKFGTTSGPSIACDMYGSSASLIQMKQRIDSRPLHEVSPADFVPPDVSMLAKQTFLSETQKATASPIEMDGRNGPNQTTSSNLCVGDHPDAFWLRAINSALSKNSGPALLSAAAQLNIPRTAASATLSRITDNAANKSDVDVHQIQRMSEEQLRCMLDFMGGTNVCKRNEMMPNNFNQAPKADTNREQGQLGGIFGSMIIQDRQKSNTCDPNQVMHHRDKQGPGNFLDIAGGSHHVQSDQDLVAPYANSDFLGPSSSRSNAPSSEDQNLKSSQTKEAFCQRIGCTLPSGNDRPLLRLTRNSPKCCNNLDGELSINKQKDSNQVIISENVDHPGDIESSEFKQSFRADAHIVESRENAMSAALGTNSTIVVSVGENDSGAEKGYQEQNKIVERNDIMNTGCESFQWKQDNGKVTSEAGAVQDECPVDLTYCRETVEDHLADTAAKGSVKGVIDTGSPKKEEQMSNVCSKISDNILSEFSDAGHVINDDICNVDYGGKKLMHSDVVDEGSGIGKCCSSDAVDTGIWTRRKLASASGDKNVLVSTSLLPNPTSNGDNAVSKVRSSLRLKRLHKSTECLSADGEQALKTVGKTGKFEKKRRTMKWKRLDATALPFEDNSKKSVPLNHAKKIDFTPVPSCTMVKASDMQNITASTSSNLTKGLNLKRKRSAVVSGNPLTSNHKIQEFQEDRRKEAPVQQVHFKGDKLVIRIQKNLMERKPKQNGVDGVKFDRTSSRKVTKYDTMSSGKALAIRNNDIVFTEDKIKLSQCKSSSAVRNIRAGHGKPTLKSAKMASLSSILKHAKRHVDTPCKSGKQSSAAEVGSEALNKNVGKLGKFSISEKRQANELKTSFEYIMEANPRRDGKESNKSVNVKEVRKRSLSELSRKNNHENKSTQFSAPSTSTQSKNVCQTDPSSALGSEFSNNHCLFPRGERTLRLRFKCKNKSNFLKPNSTASTGTSNWHSANHNSFSNIYFQSDDVWRPEYCELENGAQSVAISVAKDDLDESKIEISPLEEPLCSVTKEMRKCLSSITFQKKETESIIKTIPKVSKKQKHVRNDEKVQVHVGECTEMIDVSCVPRVGCNTVKIKKRKNGEIHGEKHGRDPLQKKCRIENTALGPNFEADVRCCVCGDLNEESINRLVQCGSCLIKVHQACYGVSKIPKSGWTCRACKSNLNDIVCVLCGYGGGAMTRAQKTRNVVKSLLQVWQVTRDTNLKALPEDIRPPQNKCDAVNEFGAKSSPRISESNKAEFGASGNGSMNILSLGKQDNNKSFLRSNLEDVQLQIGSIKTGKAPNYINSEFQVHNTITAAVNNPGVTQWVHMVCGLWMPGTRCLNVATMGVFDISGATIPRKKVVCSICKRPGGLCIQCRVVKCSVPFHPWCAHQKASLQQLAHSARQEVEFSLYQEELKQTHIGFAHSYSVILATQGLLQSEREGDRGDKVGFYGRCLLHAKYSSNHSDKVKSRDNLHINTQSESDQGTCARTKGYKGRKSWEEARAELQRHSDTENTRVVTQEQINAWLHINGRKSCTRGFIKSPNTDVKSDYRREYLRFKQEQGWKRLVVYKSGIHALGLYTAQNILKGEMVVEYIGEIIGLHVADKREIAYHSRGKMQYEGACYFFRIDKENIIDATRKGGIARFVNHSCSPNCAAKVISVRTQKKVVFFAERDINAGEEITYDYHFNHEDDGMKIPCFCNSRNCRRYLN